MSFRRDKRWEANFFLSMWILYVRFSLIIWFYGIAPLFRLRPRTDRTRANHLTHICNAIDGIIQRETAANHLTRICNAVDHIIQRGTAANHLTRICNAVDHIIQRGTAANVMLSTTLYREEQQPFVSLAFAMLLTASLKRWPNCVVLCRNCC